MKYYCVIDLEAGGIGTDKTLLSLYVGILDEKFNLLNELDIKIKPDNGIYILTAKGMEVNKINIVEHDKTAITYKEAGTQLYNFIKGYSTNKLIPLGHGVAFDCKFLQNTIISQGSWEKFVSYRTVDTGCIARFLMMIGKLQDCEGSLESLVKLLGIKLEGNHHEAKFDALASVEVLKKLIEIAK